MSLPGQFTSLMQLAYDVAAWRNFHQPRQLHNGTYIVVWRRRSDTAWQPYLQKGSSKCRVFQTLEEAKDFIEKQRLHQLLESKDEKR
jgi:hypothetical protein